MRGSIERLIKREQALVVKNEVVGEAWPSDWVYYPIKTPTPTQVRFVADKTRNLGIGGAMRGGKTRPCIWKLWQYCIDYPGIRIAIVRLELDAAERFILEDMRVDNLMKKPVYDMKCEYRKSKGFVGFTFSNGSIIMAISGKEAHRIQGGTFDVILLEEAPQLGMATLEMVYRQSSGTVLAKMKNYPNQIIWNGNQEPGYFKEEYALPYERGEDLSAKARAFYPVSVNDNPSNSEEWKRDNFAMLKAKHGEENAKRIIDGSWRINSNRIFPYIVDDMRLPIGQRDIITWEEFSDVYGGLRENTDFCVGMDPGISVPTAAELFVIAENTIVFFNEFYEKLRGQANPFGYLVEKVRRLGLPSQRRPMWIPDPTMNRNRAQGVRIDAANPFNIMQKLGCTMFQLGKSDIQNDVEFMRKLLVLRRVKFVEGRCKQLLAQIDDYETGSGEIYDGKQTEIDMPHPKCADHAIDAAKYGMKYAALRLDLSDCEIDVAEAPKPEKENPLDESRHERDFIARRQAKLDRRFSPTRRMKGLPARIA